MEPGPIVRARDALRARLGEVPQHELTMGRALELARELFEAIPRDEAMGADGHEVSLQLETFARTDSSVTVELVWRWAHAETLEARPERLRLRFDVVASALTREVVVRSRDYPHAAAFVRAAMEAAELDPSAPASDVRLELDLG